MIVIHLHTPYKIPLFASLEIIVFFPPLTAIETVFHDSPTYALCNKESLFCHQREPLFYKSGKSDIFLRKKFVMSLFRTIFVFGNGREVANLGFVFTECFHSAFALGSLCLRSGFALPSLWVRFRRRRKAQGNAAAETRHKQEVFDIFVSR